MKWGLKVVESKFFNTHLKGIYKIIPEHRKVEYIKNGLNSKFG